MRFSALCVVGALSCASLVGALSAAPAKNANANAHSGAAWSYKGTNAPAKWGDLSPEYSACKKGVYQSPIDIKMENVFQANTASPIKFSYKGDVQNVVNNGHTIQVDFKAGSSITLDKTQYDLVQLHFHTPAEHKVAGKSFQMEAHLVHKAKNGQLLVIAILFNAGLEHPAIAEIQKVMPQKEGEKANLAKLDMSTLTKGLDSYIRLNGSLTTPPCTEGVIWIVNTMPLEASKAQVAAFTKVFGQNNRPPQSPNNRVIIETGD